MPGKLPTLSPAASRQIDGRVDELFDRLMTRLLGHGFTGRHIFIGFNEDLSLPGIFAAATTGEGGRIDTTILNGIADIAKDYLDKHRAEAKARTKQHVQALLRDLNEGRIDADEFQNYVESDLHQLWDSVRSAVERVVETENEHAKTLGIKDGIDQINASLGIDDPVVCFIPVKDDRLCDECRRLHLLPDGVTPRVWYSSEVEAGYHKKGVDRPSWQLLHPHCRCALATVLKGFGFDEGGRITFISSDHSELAYQRAYKRPPRGEAPRLKKLGKSEPIFEPLLKFDVKYPDLARAFKEHGWEEARTTGHIIWKHPGIPGRPVPIKQDHASGSKPIDDQMLRDHYLRQAGLTIDRGGSIVPSAKHPYAEHYAKLGFTVPGYQGPAQQKTWTPQRAPEGLQFVPIEHLDPGPFEEWQAGMHAKNFNTGKAHLVPHVTAMDLGDGKLTVDRGSEVVEAARRAGMTHVPVLQQ